MASGGNDLTLGMVEILDSTDPTPSLVPTVRVTDNASGAVLAEQPLEGTSGVVVTGTDLDDRLTLDSSLFGSDIPISFEGGLGLDDLIIDAGAFDRVSHDVVGPDSGSVDLEDGATTRSISYGGLEQVTDSATAPDRAFAFMGTGETITISDDALSGGSTIESTSGLSIAFAAPPLLLEIDAGDNALLNQGHVAASQIALTGQQVDNTGTLEATSTAQGGGSVRIDASDISSSGTIAATGGGEVILTAGDTLVVGGAIDVSGEAPGAVGGTLHLLGSQVGLFSSAVIDASGSAGGGAVLVGGDYRGQGAIPTAERTGVASGAAIDVSATDQGDAGTAIVWSDGTTRFGGDIAARGGAAGGDGGLVEVSGEQDLAFRGTVDTSAPAGQSGLLMIDPANVVIVAGMGPFDDDQINDGEILQGDGTDPPPVTFTISEAKLESLTGNVTIEATNDITLEDLSEGVPGGPLNDGQLSFQAGPGEQVVLTADADGDGSGDLVVSDASGTDTIETDGGDLTLSGSSLTLGHIDIGAGTLTLTATGGGVALRDVTAGALIVDAAGNVIVAGTIAVTGATELSAPGFDIALNDPGNAFGDAVSSDGENVTLAASGAIALGTTAATGSLSVTAGGAVTQQAGTALDVDGATTLSAAGVDIVLDESGNDFGGAVSSGGASVTLVASGPIALGATTATVDLSVTAGGAITQQAGTALDVVGTTALSAAGFDITLDAGGSAFGGSVSSSGASVTLVASGPIALGATTATADLSVTAGGAITQQAGTALNVAGATVLSAAGFDITLDETGNDFTGARRHAA
jgi:hypothetical protein